MSTGGFAFFDSNDFDLAFERILDDTSFRYLLGYRPPDAGREPGPFVPVEVQMDGPGVEVRARRGYRMPNPS